MSPEVLRDQEASRGCDLWAVGCMIFQMLVGRPMFRAENEYLTFQQILNHPAEDFAYPPGFPDVARDLIDKLLLQEPRERIGAGTDDDGNGYLALKSHPFFDGVDWDRLGSMQSPYLPQIGRLPPTDNVRLSRCCSSYCRACVAADGLFCLYVLRWTLSLCLIYRTARRRIGSLQALRPSCKCRLAWRLRT